MSQTPFIPVHDFKNGFTTCKSLKDLRLTYFPLDNEILGVHKVWSKCKHTLVQPPLSHSPSSIPPPTLAWEAVYPKGSINPSGPVPGGFGFYLSGPSAFARQLHEGASEVIFSYRIMLQEGWEWVKGGKLPGFFGGVGQLAYHCSGGRKDNRCQCFDLRPMWRASGIGELYAYLPLDQDNTNRLKEVPPVTIENADYGFSVGRSAFNLERAVGNWVTIAFRIKLNDVGMYNGKIDMWVDGNLVISAAGLAVRKSPEAIIKGMHFQTFFGGHTDDWASPKDQRAWFADVTGAIL